jgi:hypothetical protein
LLFLKIKVIALSNVHTWLVLPFINLNTATTSQDNQVVQTGTVQLDATVDSCNALDGALSLIAALLGASRLGLASALTRSSSSASSTIAPFFLSVTFMHCCEAFYFIQQAVQARLCRNISLVQCAMLVPVILQTLWFVVRCRAYLLRRIHSVATSRLLA